MALGLECSWKKGVTPVIIAGPVFLYVVFQDFEVVYHHIVKFSPGDNPHLPGLFTS